MSLIYFRGKAILPPLIEESDCPDQELKARNSTQGELEEKVLSVSADEALNIILPGFSNKDVIPKLVSDIPRENLNTDDRRIELTRKMETAGSELSTKLPTNPDYPNYNDAMAGAVYNMAQLVSEVEHKESPVDSITSASVSDIESGICSESINAADTPNAKSDSRHIDEDINVLKQDCGTTGHLEDYLSLLTNRSCYNLYGSMETPKSDTEASPRETEQYVVESVGRSGKKTPSESCDSSIRSVGSTYMDGYLGQLTDQSWIEYPTEGNLVPKNYANKDTEQSITQLSGRATQSQTLQRKLQFINPDSFFNGHSFVKRSTSIPSQLSSVNNENNNASDSSPIVRDISTPVDINSSIFDKDYDDSMFGETFQSFPASNRALSVDDNSINTVVSCTASGKNHVSDHDELHQVSSAPVNIDNETNFSDGMQPTSYIHTNKISYLENESYNAGYVSQECGIIDSNEIKVPDLEKELTDVSNCFQHSHISDVEEMSEADMEAYVTANCSQNIELMSNDCDISSNLELAGGSEFSNFVNCKMLEFLQSKHLKELDNLRRKHEDEIQQLTGNFHKLSFGQMKELESCIMKNDSMENLFEIYDQLIAEDEVANVEGSLFERNPVLSSSSSMPSFFLHDDKCNIPGTKSVELSHSDRISKLFSPRSPQSSSSANMTTLFGQQTLNQSGGPSDYQGDYNALRIREFYHREAPSSMLSPIKEMSTSEVLEAQLSYYKHLESGLDLVPTREKDLMSLKNNYELTPSVLTGICKFQAVIRGRIIRKIMATEKVKQLLSTLMEVSKLASQFHDDIMSDNIERGDVNFHKALFNEERTARQKLWHLLIELPSTEQFAILRQDDVLKRKLSERRDSNHNPSTVDAIRPICRSSSMPLPQNKRKHATTDTRKATKLRLPQKVPTCVGSIAVKSNRRGTSLPSRGGKAGSSAGAVRNQSSSPVRECAKRQPLSPRKNIAASNLPIRQRGLIRSTLLRENNSRKTGAEVDKTEGANKPPKFTGPISRPCHQKNSGTSRKPWR